MELWVGTDDGVCRVDGNVTRELEGTAVSAVAVGPSAVWCIGDRSTLWRRDVDGWTAVAPAPPGDELRCVAETGGGVLVGTAQGHLLRLDGGELAPVPSFDEVEGRDKWWNVGGLGDQGNVRTIAEAPDGTLYVNIHVGGIYRSRDGGRSWTPTIDQEVDVHEVLALPDDVVVAATGAGGFVRSDDAGDTWTSVTDGLPADGWGGYTRAVAAWGDGTFLVTGSRGAYSELEGGVLAGVYRWTPDDPDRLHRCTNGLPDGFEDNIDTGRLTAGPGAAAFGAGGTVYVTEDAGLTWRTLADGLPPIRWVRPT